ncbi:hypothetical protein PMAYCL1PPCAC_19065, partial [Pristionchus mayeri]
FPLAAIQLAIRSFISLHSFLHSTLASWYSMSIIFSSFGSPGMPSGDVAGGVCSFPLAGLVWSFFAPTLISFPFTNSLFGTWLCFLFGLPCFFDF